PRLAASNCSGPYRSAPRPQKFVLPPRMRERTHEYGVPVVGCCRSSTTQLRVNRLAEYDMTFLYFSKAGFDPYGRSRKLYSATSIGRSPGGSRPRRFEAYGHSIVRYSVFTSIIRPASSSSTLTPAIA